MGESEDRGRARRVAARAEIQDVRLIRSKIELVAVPVDGRQYVYDVEVTDTELDWQPGQANFAVRCAYDVTIGQMVVLDAADDTQVTEKEQSIATIAFTMAALFRLGMREGDEPATDDELSAYAASTGAFALHPFAREYVYDITGRLKLPALTLPVRLISVTEDEEVR
jgi:hypothetical protein